MSSVLSMVVLHIAPILRHLPRHASTTNWMLWYSAMMVSKLNVYSRKSRTMFFSPFSLKEPQGYCSLDTPPAYAHYPNGTYTWTRYSQFCINDTDSIVCSSHLDEADINLICGHYAFSDGYVVQAEDVEDKMHQPVTPIGITNITCPDDFRYFDSYTCSYEVSHDHCEASGGPSITKCIYEGKGNNNLITNTSMHTVQLHITTDQNLHSTSM